MSSNPGENMTRTATEQAAYDANIAKLHRLNAEAKQARKERLENDRTRGDNMRWCEVYAQAYSGVRS